MGKTSPLIDLMGNIFRHITDINSILNNSNELKKVYVKTNVDDADEVERLIKTTKELLDNLEKKTTKLHTYFNTNYTSCIKDVSTSECNGNESANHDSQNKTNVKSNKESKVDSTKPTERNKSSIENGIDTNAPSCSDLVDDNSQTVSDSSKVDELPDSTESKDCKDESKVFLKCVDISKLVNPNILPHLTTPKSASKKGNDPVFIILDSDSDDETSKASKRKKNADNKANAKGRKDNLWNNKNETSQNAGKSWSQKRSSRTGKKKVTYVISSSSDFSSLSDVISDSDDDAPRKKRAPRSKQLFNEKHILSLQSDKKLSYKAYVRLERVPCEKLKENYLKKRESLEIERLANLNSLQKRCRSPATSTDSGKKTTQNQKKKSKNVDAPDGNTSDSSAVSDVLADPNTAQADDQAVCNTASELNASTDGGHGKVADSNPLGIVLDAINSDLQESHNDDSDQNMEQTSKEKEKLNTPEGEANKNDDETTKDKENDSGLIDAENNKDDEDEKSKDKESSEDESGHKEKKSKEKESNEESNCASEKNTNTKKKDTTDDESSCDDNKKKSSKKDKHSSSEADENSADDNKKSKEKATNDESDHEDNKRKTKGSSDESCEAETSNKKSKKSETTDESDDSKKRKKKKRVKHSTSSDHSSDDDKKKKNKKSKKSSDDESDSDSNKKKKSDKKEKSKWRKDSLLTSKLSESDSEEEFQKHKKSHEKYKSTAHNKRSKKKAIVSDSDEKDEDYSASGSNSSSSESEKEKEENATSEIKKRRRIKRVDDSSEDEEGNKSTRKTIRKVIAHESLAESTKKAEKEEKERKARILERQKKYNKIFDQPIDATLEKLVLDFDEESKKELLSVHPAIVKNLKPHQGKGVQFMWDTCYESVERAKSTAGSGCILAHCMGLGKTLQVIALTHTLLMNDEITNVKHVLVVCPLSTVLNWAAEYKRWLRDVEEPELNVFELVSTKNNAREFVVEDWHKDGGILIMGYDMFRNLSNPTNKRLKKKAREIFQRGLVDPGPDLVVCDEGHLLKNEKTNLSIAMNRIRSSRRIVLTGTPMQNNLKEYYCMVQFVKPNLLGTYKEYINRFVNPITNGQYTDSTTHDINIMRKRSHVLHTMLDGIVQRKDYCVLTPYLPPKYEYVLFLRLTPLQIKLYQHYMSNFSQRPSEGKIKSSFLFKDFQEFQRICTHPQVLLMKSREAQAKDFISSEDDSEGSLKDFIDDETDKSSGSSSSESDGEDSDKSSDSKKKSTKKPEKRMTRTSAAAQGIDVEKISSPAPEGWWTEFCSEKDYEDIGLSSKLYLLFKIIEECEMMGDKLLVFSQSLLSLNVIEYFLAKIDEATQQDNRDSVCGFSGSWSVGQDYFRLDGSTSCDNRQHFCKRFNDKDNLRARLFLISTKAGGLGINLVGANRVIIFDVSWNPSHDTQSIYRVYRFGQTKPCYIYRFVIWGTMETKVYERQVTKQAISKRVIDEQQIDRHYNQNDLAELYKFDPEPNEDVIPLVPKDILFGELLQKEKERIFKYHEHQSLLENKEDEELNEAERKAAWEEFEHEKTTRVTVNASTLGWIKNVPVSSIHIALRRIVQRDNPGWNSEQVLCVVPSIVEQLRLQVDEGKLMLFDRVVEELRDIQVHQQKNFQEYLKRQQQFQHQQQQQQMYMYQQQLRQQMFPQLNTSDVVELID